MSEEDWKNKMLDIEDRIDNVCEFYDKKITELEKKLKEYPTPEQYSIAMKAEVYKETNTLRERIEKLELLVKNQPTGIQLRDRIEELEKDFKDNGVYTNKEEYQSIFTEINELKEQKTQLGNIFNADISEIREVLWDIGKTIISAFVILQIPDDRIQHIEGQLKKLDGKEPTDDIPYEKDMIIYKGRAYNQKLHRIVEKADLEWLFERFFNPIQDGDRTKYNKLKEKYQEDADD